MSKYIKLEDAIHNINLEVTGRKEYTGDMKANLFFALDDLPTIEVSEDAISRKYLFGKVYDMDNDDLVVDLKDIEDAPSVVPSCQKNRQVEMAECEGCKHYVYQLGCTHHATCEYELKGEEKPKR